MWFAAAKSIILFFNLSKCMKLTFSRLLPGAQNARGVAVIIDVFRAFSCTPLLFALGIEKSILVKTPQEALALKKHNSEFILIGEISGMMIEGFDFGNSPTQILKAGSGPFKGKTVVQRTSSGVQGVIAALEVAEEVLLSSYNLAAATARYLISRQVKEVNLVAMGWNLSEIAPEDEWCARYIAHIINAENYDHLQALREIIFHRSTQKFLRENSSHFPAEDPILCLQPNIYDFVLKAERKGKWVAVRQAIP
jgi:2-phosphosulfolactate phosphatase